jgi:putative peptidoglycan lipid II flippase
VDTLFAYALETGTVTALYCANRLVQLPLSLFGFSTAVAVLPGVSAAMSRGDVAGARAHVTGGLRQVVFLVLPSALGLIVLRRPLVRLLYERGEFTPEDSARTATAMAILALGLLAFALVKVVVTGFHGAKDTRTPVIVSSCAMLLNIALNFALVRPLGYKGLVIATSISYGVNYAALHLMLERRIGRLVDARTLSVFLRIALAAVLANALGYGAFVRLAVLFGNDTITARLTHTLVPVALAGAAYAGLCVAFQVEEASAFLHSVTRRFRRIPS